MKVYEFRGFPNPARVRIALAEKGLLDEVEFVHVDVPGGEHKKSAFLAKNPKGTVPVLELDDGTTISECTAITEYLDHVRDEPKLTGRSAKERAVIHMMQRRAEAGVLDAVGSYFQNATKALGPDITGYQCSEWGNHQREQALAGMRYLNDVLKNRAFLAGDDFSVADITEFAGLAFADFVKIEVPQDCTNLKEWNERVATRPSVAGLA